MNRLIFDRAKQEMKAFMLILTVGALRESHDYSSISTRAKTTGDWDYPNDWDASELVHFLRVEKIMIYFSQKFIFQSEFDRLLGDEVINEIREEVASSNMLGKYRYHDYSDYV